MSADESDVRPHAGKAQYPQDAQAPQQVNEAEAFTARHAEVQGFGLGVMDNGEPCVVLFSSGIDPQQVPESLDGLPVRVDEPGPFDGGA
ncbi:MAG: hypothetical protein WA892_06100 [Ornithinimicrobium sp.]